MAKITINIEDVGDQNVNFGFQSDPPVPILNEETYEEIIATFTPAQKILLEIVNFMQMFLDTNNNVEVKNTNAEVN